MILTSFDLSLDSPSEHMANPKKDLALKLNHSFIPNISSRKSHKSEIQHIIMCKRETAPGRHINKSLFYFFASVTILFFPLPAVYSGECATAGSGSEVRTCCGLGEG